jgi:urea transport system permease protein
MQYTGFAPNDPNYVPPPGLSVIAPLGNPWTAIAASLVFPPVVAALFGFVIFRLGVRGVYFALVTQAFLLAVFLLVDNQQRFTGGHVGIKDMASLELFGQSFNAVKNVRATVLLVAAALIVSYFSCALLVRSKFGKILTAIRDNENRVLALGYTTALYKTFVFSFAGLLAGLAGALYVLANHPVCGATYVSVPFSIEAVILVAVGGRGGLYGAVLGALLVGFGQYYIQSALPDFWPIAEGILFVLTVLFLPRGLSPAAGPGALLGLLGGVFFIIYLEKSIALVPFLSDATVRRIFVGCPVILLSVFVPRIVTILFQKIIGAAAAWMHARRPVSPVPT